MTTEKENFPELLRGVWPMLVQQFSTMGKHVPEVAQALCEVLSNPGKPMTERAAEYLEQLERENKYLRDCYDTKVLECDTWKSLAEEYKKASHVLRAEIAELNANNG